MKEKVNIKTKIAVVGIIVLTLLIIGIISVPNVIEKVGTQVAEKEEQDAGVAQVLSGKTFTSSAAGVGAVGSLADFTNNLQTATVASNATGISTINVPAGYYEQIQVDASAVYNKGIADGSWSKRLGQEVTVGGQPFFILYENTIDNTTTLLAKYCLNTNGSTQSINGGISTYRCPFSSANYWSSVWTSGSNLNLNSANGNTTGDAMTKAQNYARAIGGKSASGRLLTQEEINALKVNYYNMIGGKYNTASGEAYLYYWTGTTSSSTVDYVIYWSGTSNGVYSNRYKSGNGWGDPDMGVRPVITVSSSLVP